VYFTDNSELFDISPDGVIDYTPTFEDISYSPIHVFRVIASDGLAQSYYPMTLEFRPMNTAPTMTLPERLFAVEGEPFAYQVKAVDREGDTLTYGDDSDFFDIIPTTGQIVFTAVNSNVGKHQVTLTVSDGEHTTNATVEFYIYEAGFEDRDVEGAGWAVLAMEVALIVVGLLFLFNLKRRQDKEARDREEGQ